MYIGRMVVGIGLDLLTVERMRGFRERRGERGLARLFTEAELRYCLGMADPAPSLAARFAAKEAFFKAVALGWGAGGDWRDVEVSRGARGAPSLGVSGRAAEAARSRGARGFHVSLTHTAETAAAMVVLEG
ncbi:MAG TPA: holo-ACP synthase [Longimicrobiales bacterium]|nr:holo-ACP synthase [Longimicrobiales bacterium]